MKPRSVLLIHSFATTALVACLALSAVLAWSALTGSQEKGAGAAQGNLGFYLVLRLITPAVVALVAFALLIEWWAERRTPRSHSWSRTNRALGVGCALAIAWNWFYLLVEWRA